MRKPHSWHLVLDSENLRTPWNLSGPRWSPKYRTWVWANCNFPLAILNPFKAESFSKRMLSSCEEAWEAEQRSKSSTYCNKVEPLGNLISSRSAFRIGEKIRSLSKTWTHYYPGELFVSSQVKAKRHRVASSTGIPRNEMHKWIAVKNLVPEGMNVSNVWVLGKTGCCLLLGGPGQSP